MRYEGDNLDRRDEVRARVKSLRELTLINTRLLFLCWTGFRVGQKPARTDRMQRLGTPVRHLKSNERYCSRTETKYENFKHGSRPILDKSKNGSDSIPRSRSRTRSDA